MTEQDVAHRRDPIQETCERVSAAVGDAVPKALVADAWRSALFPELELRVGLRMSSGMSDARLAEFEALLETEDEEGASRWLAHHVPHHPQIVAEELDRLVAEAVDWFVRAGSEQSR